MCRCTNFLHHEWIENLLISASIKGLKQPSVSLPLTLLSCSSFLLFRYKFGKWNFFHQAGIATTFFWEYWVMGPSKLKNSFWYRWVPSLMLFPFVARFPFYAFVQFVRFSTGTSWYSFLHSRSWNALRGWPCTSTRFNSRVVEIKLVGKWNWKNISTITTFQNCELSHVTFSGSFNQDGNFCSVFWVLLKIHSILNSQTFCYRGRFLQSSLRRRTIGFPPWLTHTFVQLHILSIMLPNQLPVESFPVLSSFVWTTVIFTSICGPFCSLQFTYRNLPVYEHRISIIDFWFWRQKICPKLFTDGHIRTFAPDCRYGLAKTSTKALWVIFPH